MRQIYYNEIGKHSSYVNFSTLLKLNNYNQFNPLLLQELIDGICGEEPISHYLEL